MFNFLRHYFASTNTSIQYFRCNNYISTIFVAEQFTDTQENIDALHGETVTVITELPETGLEVTWMKNNVPLSITGERYQTVNQDCSYQLVIPDVTVEDTGQYKVLGGGFESMGSVRVYG